MIPPHFKIKIFAKYIAPGPRYAAIGYLYRGVFSCY